jgi:hypothetical protein
MGTAIASQLGRPARALPALSFTTENGAAMLSREFVSVTLHTYEVPLSIPSAEPVVACVASVRGLVHQLPQHRNLLVRGDLSRSARRVHEPWTANICTIQGVLAVLSKRTPVVDSSCSAGPMVMTQVSGGGG